MSWSIISYQSAWAHAHDWELVLFMSLAPKFINQSPEFQDLEWLSKWKQYWLNHKLEFVNGCSDLNLEEHLVSAERRSEFIYFLEKYSSWLEEFGTVFPKDKINKLIGIGGMQLTEPCKISYLLEFSEKLKAVVNKNFEHDKVQRENA